MNNNPILISIIIPVYQVEKELPRCLDSIISQINENFEIILIDDGSYDNSGILCDDYASKYSSIRVIHQENKGLSFVRNRGICEAKGVFISFIDSDDFVLNGLYKRCEQIIRKYSPDLICFEHFDCFIPDIQIDSFHQNNQNSEIFQISKYDALDQIFFPNNIDVISCNKIIRRSLFENIYYPVGKLYEDMFTTYKIISKAEKIFCIKEKYYVYCHRPGSIGGQMFSEKTLDLIKAVEETYKFGLSFCTEIHNLHVGYLLWLVNVANIMIRSNYFDKQFFNKIKYLSRKYRKTNY